MNITAAAPAWVDLTRIVDAGSPHVPAFPAPAVRRVWAMPEKPANVTAIDMWCHVGTHIDAPLHFFPGALAAHELPLRQLIGSAVVWEVDVPPAGEITRAMLASGTPPLRPGDLVLINASWAGRWGTPAYLNGPHLSVEAARWLVDAGAALVGVDFATPDLPPGLRPDGFDFPVHRTLLGNGVLIAEHLADLSAVSRQRVDLVVAPLPIRGADGAPCRIYARTSGEPAGAGT